VKLDLGACDRKIPGFLSVDKYPPADFIVDLAKARIRIDPDGSFAITYDRWPFEDSTVEEIRASHIVEHLPSKIHTMNEIHRILKPGGIVTIDVPRASGENSAGFHQDPDHHSGWTMNAFTYWDDRDRNWRKFHERTGNTAKLRVVSHSTRTEGLNIHKYEPVDVIHVILEAVKP
jgi:SAM-dependent methyltransferase